MFNYLYKKLGLSKKDQSKLYDNFIEFPLSNGLSIETNKQFILGLAGTSFSKPLIGNKKIIVYIPNTGYSFSTYDYNYYGHIIYHLETTNKVDTKITI